MDKKTLILCVLKSHIGLEHMGDLHPCVQGTDGPFSLLYMLSWHLHLHHGALK